jgi:hypothetical protein
MTDAELPTSPVPTPPQMLITLQPDGAGVQLTGPIDQVPLCMHMLAAALEILAQHSRKQQQAMGPRLVVPSGPVPMPLRDLRGG